MNPAVVIDETQLSEFVHEKINSCPCCSNHLGKRLLRYLGKHFLRLVVFRAKSCEQQQGARQAFLAGINELVNQVRLHADFSRSV